MKLGKIPIFNAKWSHDILREIHFLLLFIYFFKLLNFFYSYLVFKFLAFISFNLIFSLGYLVLVEFHISHILHSLFFFSNLRFLRSSPHPEFLLVCVTFPSAVCLLILFEISYTSPLKTAPFFNFIWSLTFVRSIFVVFLIILLLDL